MHNTIIYICLIVISLSLACVLNISLGLKFLFFFLTYYILFFILEFLDIFPGIKTWRQDERTSKCYDWFNHYLKKDYGIINGKPEYDYTENLYLSDYKSKNALENKYNIVFNELNLSQGKTLLDCGCGVGTWMEFCKKRGVNVIGLTLSKEQKEECKKKGLIAYVQDYRILNKEFINKFDAISLLGSAEHITISSGFYKVKENSYNDFKSLYNVLKQYLKPNGKILMTLLVRGNFNPEKSTAYDLIQAYIMDRHYGGYYSYTDLISKAITDNGFEIDSIKDYTRDYHWTSIVEPDHFGHWWINWKEEPLDKMLYFFKGLLTDPFLLHHWLYYGMDTWMWQFGGYQKTPLTDEQIKNCPANLKYFVSKIYL